LTDTVEHEDVVAFIASPDLKAVSTAQTETRLVTGRPALQRLEQGVH
jgi:hypothetical protein